MCYIITVAPLIIFTIPVHNMFSSNNLSDKTKTKPVKSWRIYVFYIYESRLFIPLICSLEKKRLKKKIKQLEEDHFIYKEYEKIGIEMKVRKREKHAIEVRKFDSSSRQTI